MVAGIGLPETARMYPHHFKGEGQFVAHLQFKGENPAPKFKASKSNLSREQLALWHDFAQKHLRVNWYLADFWRSALSFARDAT